MARATLTVVVFLAGCATSMSGRVSSPGRDCAWQVCVSSSAAADRVFYQVRNSGPVVATVSLSFRLLQNVRLTDSVPIVRVVEPGTRVRLTQLERIDPNATFGAQPIVEIDLGSESTVPDPGVAYAMPFGGTEPRQLVGGYGSDTHLAQNFFAVDFAMPEGTPVVASRGGVVVELQDGFTEGGLIPALIDQANLVVVAHPDGTLAFYGHLSSGLSVSVGDRVERGDLLGLSGSTGFSGMPHLHFHVGKRLTGNSAGRTIPVDFVDDQGREVGVNEGAWYEPARERNRVR